MGRPSYLPLIASLLARYAAKKPDASFVVVLAEINQTLSKGRPPHRDSSVATASDPQIADVLAQMVGEVSDD